MLMDLKTLDSARGYNAYEAYEITIDLVGPVTGHQWLQFQGRRQ